MAEMARAAGARADRGRRRAAALARHAGPATAGGARAFTVFEDALRAFDFAPNRGSVFSAHQMGTVRMGGDPATHPVEPCGTSAAAGWEAAAGRSSSAASTSRTARCSRPGSASTR